MLATACTEPSFANDQDGAGALGDASSDGAATANDPDSVVAHDASANAADAFVTGTDAAASLQDAAIASEGAAPNSDTDAGASHGGADAGGNVAADAAGPEASTPGDPVPAWAKPLIGRFAKRSVLYAYDDFGDVVTVTLDISLLTISANAAGELSMLSQQCAFSVHWESGGASMVVVKPESIEPTTFKLSLGQAPHFSSDTATQTMGYDPSRASHCGSGADYAKKFSDQTWITGSNCTCSATPAVLPWSTSDCRVIDQDGDGRGGIGMKGSDLAPSVSAALTNGLKIVDGEVRPDGEHVFREQHTRNVACLLNCFTFNEVLCPGGETLVRPLAANATCSAALDKLSLIPLPTAPKTDCRAKSP